VIVLTRDQKTALKKHVEAAAKIKTKIKELQEDLKGYVTKAQQTWEIDPKAYKQAVKEHLMTEAERLRQHELEENMHHLRAALGTLVDLPLGKHAVEQKERATAH
jgi:ATP-dependent Lon protease